MQSESGGLPERQVVQDWSSAVEEEGMNNIMEIAEKEMEKGIEFVSKILEKNDNLKEKENLQNNLKKKEANLNENLEDKGKEKGEIPVEDPLEGPSTRAKKLYSEALGGKKKRNEDYYSYTDHRRKNVVCLHFTGNIIPTRETVGKDLLMESMQFTSIQVYALIHISGSRDFDVSFRNILFLDAFWAKYEKVKDTLYWEDFEVIKITENATRYITILFRNESVPSSDVSFWLRQRCKMLGALSPIYDSNGFWNGGYKVKVQLKTSETGLQHLPNFINIGRDRGYLFYPGQPKVCNKCGSSRHFGANCAKLYCNKCSKTGHESSNCTNMIVCNPCNKEGHLYINCPRSVNNCHSMDYIFNKTVEEDMDLEAEELARKQEEKKSKEGGSL
uniref:CCHC-type domain-containing protein n=1 Tax=Latimeria chalumnae TaxID=7897 RepID=H3AHH8_LATCH